MKTQKIEDKTLNEVENGRCGVKCVTNSRAYSLPIKLKTLKQISSVYNMVRDCTRKDVF